MNSFGVSLKMASRRWTCCLLLLAPLSLGGCDDAPDPVAACLRKAPSIREGIYGCATYQNDVGTGDDVEPKVIRFFDAEVFTSEPPPTPGDGLTPLALIEGDPYGFYELPLAPGPYWLCTPYRRCGPVTIPAGTAVAIDYRSPSPVGWARR